MVNFHKDSTTYKSLEPDRFGQCFHYQDNFQSNVHTMLFLSSAVLYLFFIDCVCGKYHCKASHVAF